jgi:hypothetical protein
MKLKLSEKAGIKILAVTESLQEQEISVLHAGILKILHSNALGLIVDLTQTQVNHAAISRLRADTSTLATPLLIVTAVENLGDLLKVEDAIALLNSPVRKLMTRESQLKLKISDAQALKKELEAKLSAQTAQWSEFLKLKKRQSDMKREITLLENALSSSITAGKMDSSTPRPPMPKSALLNQILKTVLASQGILKEA